MRRAQPPLLSVACAVLGFLLVTAVTSARDVRRAAAPRKGELIDLIQRRRSLVAEQDEAVHALRDEVGAAQRQVARRSALDRVAADEAAELAMQAGTVALEGKGLTVRLKDSAREPSTEEDAAAFRIHDTDLQLVVNALFAAGAEAVAVNDSRLVATTPIRAAGDTIVVNFRPLSPPYTVSAIGADRRAFEGSDIAKRFQRWTGLFGLGFSVQQRNVSVPAYSGRVAITSAQPS
ncbi:MAG TPA: DUF881 domain-containing protein [Acidimicrobiales bacterium]|nr:DUF881 domain-containing protein [Acidimicrobiales bacterium]